MLLITLAEAVGSVLAADGAAAEDAADGAGDGAEPAIRCAMPLFISSV